MFPHIKFAQDIEIDIHIAKKFIGHNAGGADFGAKVLEAAPELMHFMFYDYTVQRFPEIFANLDPDNGTYWMLAELFNNVILSLPEYCDLLGDEGDSPYPEHIEYYPVLRELWKQDPEIDHFILNAYQYLCQIAQL